jgi:hypothetical protein
MLLGTPMYMSPEQVRAPARSITARTCTRSAASSYEMIAGTPPFVREGVGDRG